MSSGSIAPRNNPCRGNECWPTSPAASTKTCYAESSTCSRRTASCATRSTAVFNWRNPAQLQKLPSQTKGGGTVRPTLGVAIQRLPFSPPFSDHFGTQVSLCFSQPLFDNRESPE